jgi:hypothetical protein
MRSFIIVLFNYYGEKMDDDEMGVSCSMHGREEFG